MSEELKVGLIPYNQLPEDNESPQQEAIDMEGYQPAPPVQQGQRRDTTNLERKPDFFQEPPFYIILSVFTMFVCCFSLGLAGLIVGSCAAYQRSVGKNEYKERLLNISKQLNIAGIILGIFSTVIPIIVVIMILVVQG